MGSVKNQGRLSIRLTTLNMGVSKIHRELRTKVLIKHWHLCENTNSYIKISLIRGL